ncbi:hypothetical protein [Kineococcus arenarius]|uniref:hypothetical protein n=1 Tax=unclassified Kineococcus TaxID=2621656 RepID=UPI003D7C563C
MKYRTPEGAVVETGQGQDFDPAQHVFHDTHGRRVDDRYAEALADELEQAPGDA